LKQSQSQKRKQERKLSEEELLTDTATRKKPDSLCKCLTIACAILCLLEKAEDETVEEQQEWTERLLWDANKGRICDYCGINMDIPWLDILKFFHKDCWKQYREDGKLYPMPKYV
jgi:hypothetical protein